MLVRLLYFFCICVLYFAFCILCLRFVVVFCVYVCSLFCFFIFKAKEDGLYCRRSHLYVRSLKKGQWKLLETNDCSIIVLLVEPVWLWAIYSVVPNCRVVQYVRNSACKIAIFIILGLDPKVEPDRKNIVSDEIGWLMTLYKTDVIAHQEILQETLVELDSLYGRYSPRLERIIIHLNSKGLELWKWN